MFDEFDIMTEDETNFVLIKAGVPTNNKGFQYIKEGILMIIKDSSLVNNLVKGLYPALAKKFNTSAGLIERNMRHSIGNSFKSGGLIEFEEFKNVTKRPCNGFFIGTFAEIVTKRINRTMLQLNNAQKQAEFHKELARLKKENEYFKSMLKEEDA